MAAQAILQQLELLPDEEVVNRIRAGETGLFEILMRRHNQQVYRAARAIVRDEHEAEDIMQDAYVRAFTHLDQFEGRSKFSTWLLRIAVNEALARHRKRAHLGAWDEMRESSEFSTPLAAGPEVAAERSEARSFLQSALDQLPETLRTVFMLREVQELSTAETAEVLQITEENVKIRLHRAKAALRDLLATIAGEQARHLYPFEATRCDRVVAAVLSRIALVKDPQHRP
jgi:RNA polymerase sigma-70 factor (ECF subfamily)